MVTNPKHLSWTNPTQAVDQNGKTVAFDPATDMKGVEVQFDNVGAVEIDTGVVTTLDMTTLDAYKALPSGTHKVDLAILTNEGVLGGFSTSVTFLVGFTPLAPTDVVVA